MNNKIDYLAKEIHDMMLKDILDKLWETSMPTKCNPSINQELTEKSIGELIESLQTHVILTWNEQMKKDLEKTDGSYRFDIRVNPMIPKNQCIIISKENLEKPFMIKNFKTEYEGSCEVLNPVKIKKWDIV